MKKLSLLFGAILFVCYVNSQTYTTGQKDYFGNTTTTVKDIYGNPIK